MLDPRQFFRFAAESYDLLRDLYYRTGGVSDGRLREMVAARRREGDSSVDTQVANLQRLRMIEASPGTEARWELTHQVRSLMRFLLREHRLTSVRVIQGYLDSLEDARTGLADAVSDGDGDAAVRAVSEVTETVERLRQDSSANREAIFLEVMKIRSNRERLPAVRRFERINRLWSGYMEPMRDLVDVRKSMESELDAADRALHAAGLRFASRSAVASALDGCRARLLRMRREVASDFHESLREVEPLYESLRAESQLARGASEALRLADRRGMGFLDPAGMLRLPVWRTEGLLADGQMEAVLHRLSGYTPERPPVVVGEAAEPPPQRLWDIDEVAALLREELPVDDLLAWLAGTCGGCGAAELLRLYGHVYAFPPVRTEFAAEPAKMDLDGVGVEYTPLRLRGSDHEAV
ncbi:MAG: hypothetical protein R6U36_07965 [Candidatus Fermentibacteraceae bacterium]